jgi:hypothetical protein
VAVAGTLAQNLVSQCDHFVMQSRDEQGLDMHLLFLPPTALLEFVDD